MSKAWNYLIAFFLTLIGICLIANGACIIQWTNKGGITVSGVSEETGIDGTTVKIQTEEEINTIAKDRKGFVQAMSAINIAAGTFMLFLSIYFIMVDDAQEKITKTMLRGGRILTKVENEKYKICEQNLQANESVSAFSDDMGQPSLSL